MSVDSFFFVQQCAQLQSMVGTEEQTSMQCIGCALGLT